jgi:hypothetical protein
MCSSPTGAFECELSGEPADAISMCYADSPTLCRWVLCVFQQLICEGHANRDMLLCTCSHLFAGTPLISRSVCRMKSSTCGGSRTIIGSWHITPLLARAA